MPRFLAASVLAAALLGTSFAFSDWKPGQVPEDIQVARATVDVDASKGTELLEKAQRHIWGPNERGTVTKPYGDITAHEFDLTNNQGDGSDDNLWINANLSTNATETYSTSTTSESYDNDREMCGASPDLHGLVCKLVFSDWIGVEVVCVCKDACQNINGTAVKCANKWAHILMALVEEDTGCTEYTGQLTVPGFWGKCRPATIIDNPIPIPKKSSAADNVVGGTNYNGIGNGGVNATAAKSVNLIQGQKEAPKKPMSKLALMQSQLQQLREENTMLLKEKSDWEEHKKHLVEEYTKLTDTVATLRH